MTTCDEFPEIDWVRHRLGKLVRVRYEYRFSAYDQAEFDGE